jgi:hypothetical protein
MLSGETILLEFDASEFNAAWKKSNAKLLFARTTAAPFDGKTIGVEISGWSIAFLQAVWRIAQTPIATIEVNDKIFIRHVFFNDTAFCSTIAFD